MTTCMTDVHMLSHWGKRRNVGLGAQVLTLDEDLGDFGVTGAESTVDFKTVCIVEEGAAQGEEYFLRKRDLRYRTGSHRTGCLDARSHIQGVYFWGTLN